MSIPYISHSTKIYLTNKQLLYRTVLHLLSRGEYLLVPLYFITDILYSDYYNLYSHNTILKQIRFMVSVVLYDSAKCRILCIHKAALKKTLGISVGYRISGIHYGTNQ